MIPLIDDDPEAAFRLFESASLIAYKEEEADFLFGLANPEGVDYCYDNNSREALYDALAERAENKVN